jgi:hypothetical protein
VAPEHKPELAGANALQTVYPNRSPASVYAAAVRTAAELSLGITNQDDATMTLTFRAAGPTSSWPGQEMTAAVHPQGDAARVVVAGTSATGYRLVISDWHLSKALGLLFLDRLTSVLSATPEGEPAAPSAPSRVDQLKSLADLRDRGLLTEDEFATAKSQLLG